MSLWLSPPTATSISVPKTSLLHLWILARFGMVGCVAFKQSVSETNGALSAIDTPTSSSNAPLPWNMSVISYISWCCAFCNWSEVASLYSSTAVSLFSTRSAALDIGAVAGSAGMVGGSILYLTANTDYHESHSAEICGLLKQKSHMIVLRLCHIFSVHL